MYELDIDAFALEYTRDVIEENNMSYDSASSLDFENLLLDCLSNHFGDKSHDDSLTSESSFSGYVNEGEESDSVHYRIAVLNNANTSDNAYYRMRGVIARKRTKPEDNSISEDMGLRSRADMVSSENSTVTSIDRRAILPKFKNTIRNNVLPKQFKMHGYDFSNSFSTDSSDITSSVINDRSAWSEMSFLSDPNRFTDSLSSVSARLLEQRGSNKKKHGNKTQYNGVVPSPYRTSTQKSFNDSFDEIIHRDTPGKNLSIGEGVKSPTGVMDLFSVINTDEEDHVFTDKEDSFVTKSPKRLASSPVYQPIFLTSRRFEI